jgi:hypothetical protein
VHQPSYYVPPRRKSSNVAVGLAIIVATGIVAGAGVFVYTHKAAQPRVVTVVLPPSPAPKTDAPRRSTTTSIFSEDPTARAVRPPPPPRDLTDELDGSPAQAQAAMVSPGKAAVAPASRPTRVTSSAVDDASERANPHAPRVPKSEAFEEAGDDASESPEAARAWKRVESAYYHPDPAKALMAFDIYADDYPDGHAKPLAQYREDVLDKLWWNRVEDLFNKRKDAANSVAKTEQEIKESGADGQAFVKSVLEPRLEEQKARVAVFAKRLETEMGYTDPEPPPIGKESEMVAVRAKRDPAIYEPWKKKVLKHIRDTHGQYPWANER